MTHACVDTQGSATVVWLRRPNQSTERRMGYLRFFVSSPIILAKLIGIAVREICFWVFERVCAFLR